MRKVGVLVLLVLLAGCSSPTDKPALRWVKFLNEQTELVKAGTFDVAKFETRGSEIAEKLNHHRDPKKGEFLMTGKVLEKFYGANLAFQQAIDDAGNEEARAAFARVAAPLLQPADEPE